MGFNSGMCRPWLGRLGKVWWMDSSWDRELLPYVEEQSEAGSGHPLWTCTADMKDCLVLKHQHQKKHFLLHLSHPPLSLNPSLDSKHNMIYFCCRFTLSPWLPFAEDVTSKITQGGIHRSPEFNSHIYVLSATVWICFPVTHFHVNTNNMQYNRSAEGLSAPLIYYTSVLKL